MKILIIGGNRFFGKRLGQLLIEKDMQVTLLNRGQIDDGLGNKVRRIKMDRKDFTQDRAELKGPWDYIFDQVCYDAKEARLAIETFKNKTPHYIFTSTVSVYNPGQNLKETDFDSYNYHFTKDSDRLTNYGEAKRQAESIFLQQKNFKVTAVRFPYVLGTDDYTQRLNFHIERIQNQLPIYFPNINAKNSFIHAQDAATFLMSLMENEVLGPINCASESPLSSSRLVNMIENVVGKKAVITYSKDPKTTSPYGGESDFFVDVSRLKNFGRQYSEIENWLPDLIQKAPKDIWKQLSSSTKTN